MKKNFLLLALAVIVMAVSLSGCYCERYGGYHSHHEYHRYR